MILFLYIVTGTVLVSFEILLYWILITKIIIYQSYIPLVVSMINNNISLMVQVDEIKKIFLEL
jgi:hypothetical protein